MVKKYMAYPHHGTLFGNKKEGPTATCKDPDEFPDDYAECKRQPQKVIYYMIQFMLPNHKSVCQVPRPCPAVTTEGARHPGPNWLSGSPNSGVGVGGQPGPVDCESRQTAAAIRSQKQGWGRSLPLPPGLGQASGYPW